VSRDLVTALQQQARDIRQLGRGIRRAQLEALDATANDVRDAERLEIDDSFDRPTPHTRNAVFVQRTQGGVPEARVGLKDDYSGNQGVRAQSTYLRAQIEGGSRALKSFEKSIRGLGVMDGTQFIVPGRFARLDAYGNISRGQIVQILSQLRAFTGAETVSRNLVRRDGTRDKGNESSSAKKALQLRNAAFRRAGGQYFAVGPQRRGGLVPGIYQRQVATRRLAGAPSPRPRPIMLFVDRVSYEQRFDFWRAGQLAIDRGFPRHLDAALARHSGVAP
jgi:hypothetical protein